MQEDYDRIRCAALVKEGREITHQLKTETESIRRQMARALEGSMDEPLGAPERGTRDNLFGEGGVHKPFWQFWR